ncbi:hypothetical protein Gohar_000006, partial [Gossypium harknessii]|nr:hypothetical protein [Gossypium harknessii]
MNHFADLMIQQRWIDVKELFEFWVRSLDENGKPNKFDVNLYNHYLRANLMIGASAGDLLDFVAQMDDFELVPNLALFNLILKAMRQAKETEAAEKLLDGKNARPPFLLSVDEGLIVSALATAGRTYSSNLLDASWAILRCSLCQKKVPSPESFLGKIYAHASLGNLQKAFGTLHEFDAAHVNLVNEAEDLFWPFTSLYPLVVACSKKGFEALDS